MPLKTGTSRKTISSNIGELVDSYKSKGKIGTSKPKSKAAAVKQAVAISLKEAGMQKKAKGGMMSPSTKGVTQAPKNIVKSQEKKIKARGGNVVFKRDGNLPVGIY